MVAQLSSRAAHHRQEIAMPCRAGVYFIRVTAGGSSIARAVAVLRGS